MRPAVLRPREVEVRKGDDMMDVADLLEQSTLSELGPNVLAVTRNV